MVDWRTEPAEERKKMADGSLTGRRALVTGAASGIGRASARALAAEGARVCVADLNGGGAEQVAKEISEAGGDAFAFTLDVTSPEDNEAMVSATLSRFGGLEIAVLNAGIAVASSVHEGSVEDWDRVMAVNLRGVFLGMRAASKPMVEAGSGAIVATASVAALIGGRGMPSYYASKHGVVGLVKAAAAEFATQGIRVNAVCPGVIDTPILGPVHGVPEFTEGVLAKIHPVGRVGQPEEIANLVVFLASDRASFTTGAAYSADGGLTATLGGGGDEAATEEQAVLANLSRASCST
jgi:NAD(P)-dependent dehydrogenase (short-subunit alcohol dehydrogenase family)